MKTVQSSAGNVESTTSPRGTTTAPKLQQLGELDGFVLALLKKDVPLIVGWDAEKSLFLIANIEFASDMGPDEAAFDQESWLVYEVSDGLPGERGMCVSYYGFDEAQEAFDEACKRGHP